MQKHLSIACGLLVACLPGLAPAQQDVEQHETIEKTFTLSGAAARKVIVDNVEGSIQVTGHPGSEIRLIARKRLRAD